jgi:hypothetical protein
MDRRGGPVSTWSARQLEQRQRNGNRRRFPTPWLSRFSLRGRRRRIRRQEELANRPYVDRADGGYLGSIVTLVALIVLDSASTLFILSRGGTEANPLMQSLLERGPGWFLLVKLGLLPIAFLLLSIARYFGWVRWGLAALLLVYGGLAAYHIHLLTRILTG